jgi:HEAT repeat protein
MEILQMKNGWYRRTVLWELKRQMQDKAVGLVRDALASDPYPEVREAAALLLGEPGGEGNIDLLEKAYREDEYKVRLAAARSLNQLGRQGPMLELIPQLAAKLDSVDGGVRRNAVEQLGQFWSMSAVPYLTPALHDSNSDVRLAAVIALGNTGATGHPEVTALLEPLTKDPSKEVADWALDFLRRSKQ